VSYRRLKTQVRVVTVSRRSSARAMRNQPSVVGIYRDAWGGHLATLAHTTAGRPFSPTSGANDQSRRHRGATFDDEIASTLREL
jgi:hypothetical protein